MSHEQTQASHIPTALAVAGGPRSRSGRAGRMPGLGMVVSLVLGQGAAAVAGPLDDAGAKVVARFAPAAALPSVLESRLDGVSSSVHAAVTPQGTLYAATDKAGKGRVWLLHNHAIVAEITASASRDRMMADWPGSFAFWLGGLPVVAISWKFGREAYGIEDFGFWAVAGGGRFLGGLPGNTRSPCQAGEAAPNQDCGRCGTASGIPLDVRLVALEHDRARFAQQRAATWFHYFGAAAETFEQDYVLTASGLVPDGPARRARNALPLPQAKERVKALLHDYFQLAKNRSRQEIAPEFLTCFEQLVELAPELGQGHYNVGCMHALLGNRKDAVASVTRAIALDPKYRKVARKDPDLASVRDDPELARLLGE